MWISIPNGVILLSLLIIGVGLYYWDWRIPKTKRGRSWYAPPWHFNCRCVTMPWMRPTLEEVKKKMIKNARNFLVQAQYGDPRYGRTVYNAVFDSSFLRKEPKMKKELERRYVRVPNQHISDAAQKMFAEAGIYWGGTTNSHAGTHPAVQYEDQACLAYQYNEQNDWYNVSPISCWEQSGYTEISLVELADVLTKSTHTMMTADELKKRIGAGLDMETALVLSIEKWERLLKDENWHALKAEPMVHMDSDTCALCQYFKMKSGGKCSSCPLGKEQGSCNNNGHPWSLAYASLLVSDGRSFDMRGRELLTILADALEELRRPKVTYKQGQQFVYSGNHYVLAVATHCPSPVKMILTEIETGNRWTEEIPVKNSGGITVEEFDRIADGNPEYFTPVDIIITERREKK